MKKFCIILSFLLLFFITGCCSSSQHSSPNTFIKVTITHSTLQIQGKEQESHNDSGQVTPEPIVEHTKTFTPTNSPTSTSTPDPLAGLYNCRMEIEFLSGPLETKKTSFTVLGEDYFKDKGEKFAIGKGTGIYYESQHYFILHSAYIQGIVSRPLEAEFIRKYLESWGKVSTETIQENIDALIGSEVIWTCEGGPSFETEIDGVVRLSHETSNRLWLEPLNILEILADRKGLIYEWVGEIELMDDSRFLLGFCGWGPKSLEDERYTYYRYLVSFDMLQIKP